jgi:phosphatidylserine/phosphatidylglycerophosphate/cardiolipin synthase-like enzyme
MTRVRGSRLRISGFVDRVRCGRIPLALAGIGFLLLPAGLQAREPVIAPVSACFVPPENCAAQIVAAIDAATTEIRVQAYAFTSPPILGALASAKRRGLDVQVVLDRSNDHSASEPRYSGATFMANAGVPVWIDTHAGIAHNKLIIIDQHLVVGGSFNFSAAAQARNVENVTFIDSPDVASWFLANWTSRRDASYRFNAPAGE